MALVDICLPPHAVDVENRLTPIIVVDYRPTGEASGPATQELRLCTRVVDQLVPELYNRYWLVMVVSAIGSGYNGLARIDLV